MEEAERLCDRLALLHHGRVIAIDTPAALAAGSAGRQRISFRPSGVVDVARMRELPEVRDVVRHGDRFTVEGTGDLVAAVMEALVRDGVVPRRPASSSPRSTTRSSRSPPTPMPSPLNLPSRPERSPDDRHRRHRRPRPGAAQRLSPPAVHRAEAVRARADAAVLGARVPGRPARRARHRRGRQAPALAGQRQADRRLHAGGDDVRRHHPRAQRAAGRRWPPTATRATCGGCRRRRSEPSGCSRRRSSSTSRWPRRRSSSSRS